MAELIQSIPEYYKEIRVPEPKYPFFHVGRHEKNIKTIKLVQPPVRHQLYSISLMSVPDAGRGVNINQKRVDFRLFVISPYKEISWDIRGQQLKGLYIIFDRNFIESSPLWSNFLLTFPFFKLDNLVTTDLPGPLLEEIHHYFEHIYQVYYENQNPFDLIRAYMQLVFLLLKNHFQQEQTAGDPLTPGYLLHSKFQSVLVESLAQSAPPPTIRSPAFYARALHVHVNHLNATLKHITGKTTSQLIREHIVRHAAHLLRQTDIPVKDLAARFHFGDPTHFVAFFRMHTGLTPRKYKFTDTMLDAF